jgi:hypothetical protein
MTKYIQYFSHGHEIHFQANTSNREYKMFAKTNYILKELDLIENVCFFD